MRVRDRDERRGEREARRRAPGSEKSAVVTGHPVTPPSAAAARDRARPRRGTGAPTNAATSRAPDPPARGGARRRTPRASPATACASASGSPGRHQQAPLVAADEVGRAADRGRDHGPRGGQRLDQSDGRALVARGVHDHVEVAVDRRQIAAPAEEVHGALEPERRAQRLERLRAPRRRPRARSARPGRRSSTRARGVEEGGHVLDRHQPADDPDERRLRRRCRPRARSTPRGSSPASAPSSRPSGITRIFERRRHAQLHEVLLHRLGHGDERVGRPAPGRPRACGRAPPSGARSSRAGRGRGTCGRRSGRRAARAASRPSRPGLGRVGVHDRGPPRRASGARGPKSATRSRERRDLASEARPSSHSRHPSPPRAPAGCPRAATRGRRRAACRSRVDAGRGSGGSRGGTDPRCSGGRTAGAHAPLGADPSPEASVIHTRTDARFRLRGGYHSARSPSN